MSWIQRIEPVKLGLPAKYSRFRRTQAQAISDVLDSEKRFVALQAPPGVGKSAIAAAVASITGKPTAYLTITKGLMLQVMRDFSSMGLTSIAGANAYRCIDNGSYTCEDYARHCRCNRCPTHTAAQRDKCSASMCDTWAGSCPRKIDFQKAVRAKFFVSNYHLWYYTNRFQDSELAHGVETLILDEADAAPEALSDMLAITMNTGFLALDPAVPKTPSPSALDAAEWVQWSQEALEPVEQSEALRTELRRHYGKIRWETVWMRFTDSLKRLSGIDEPKDWAVDPQGKRAIITPLWPYQYAANSLFRSVPKVVLMSGTIIPLTMRLLGVKATEYDFHMYDYGFENAGDNVHVKTCRVTEKVFMKNPKSRRYWLETICDYLRERGDRKGIIHTVSYGRAREIVEYIKQNHPDLAPLCLTHTSSTTADTVANYRQSKSPVWIFSPSLTTGYDFPGEQCEFILWAKLPWKPAVSNVMKARIKSNRLYPGALMLGELVQGSLRGRRYNGDFCEVAIVDDTWQFARQAFRPVLLPWFKVKTTRDLPKPPPPMVKRPQRIALTS